jgi:hypothetical protein
MITKDIIDVFFYSTSSYFVTKAYSSMESPQKFYVVISLDLKHPKLSKIMVAEN